MWEFSCLKLSFRGAFSPIGKDLDAGKDWVWEKRWQRMRWLVGITDSRTWVWTNSRRWWRTGNPGMLQSMESQRVRHNWAGEQQPTLEAIWKVISSGYSVATWLLLIAVLDIFIEKHINSKASYCTHRDLISRKGSFIDSLQISSVGLVLPSRII